MIKLGCFSFMYDRETSTRIVDPLTFMRFAHELRLDTVDFALNKGFPAQDRDYLMRVRLEALRRGLTVGFVEGGGSFVGTDEGWRRSLKGRGRLSSPRVVLKMLTQIGPEFTHILPETLHHHQHRFGMVGFFLGSIADPDD